jgi:hypothetical protein
MGQALKRKPWPRQSSEKNRIKKRRMEKTGKKGLEFQ